MSRILICFLIILTVIIKINYKNSEDTVNQKFYEKCLHPTIMVCNSSETSGGTGFIIKSYKKGFIWQNVILGAAHTVIEDQDLIIKVPRYRNVTEFKGYENYDLSIYALNLEADMFVGVFTSYEEMPVVDLNLEVDLEMRDKILHVGYGLFDDIRFDSGEVTQPRTFNPFPFRGMIRTNAFTFSGDSGGPLFLENDFSVVGICHGIRKKQDTIIPQISYYKSIKDFLFWDHKVNNSLKWVYKANEPMPVLPFLKLKIKRYEFTPPR